MRRALRQFSGFGHPLGQRHIFHVPVKTQGGGHHGCIDKAAQRAGFASAFFCVAEITAEIGSSFPIDRGEFGGERCAFGHHPLMPESNRHHGDGESQYRQKTQAKTGAQA